ncbi:MAG: metalloregulator ArsR/SmtB family transcription factor [Erysipelotrichaceae bacterium]|nr:metalloregulator ArsR/SmtB family transcription factor [Erysipelotrichaceae bacterium]
MTNEKTINKLAETFKLFSDPTRIRIMLLLSEKEANVNQIATELNMNQSAISHQLKNLRANHLIKNRRDGQSIYYSLDDDHVKQIIEMGKAHVEHN